MEDRGRRQRLRMIGVWLAVILAALGLGVAMAVLFLWLLVTVG